MPDATERRGSLETGHSETSPDPEAVERTGRNLHSIIATLAADFVGIDVADIDAAVTRALRLVGLYAGADVCVVHLLRPDRGVYERSHVWVSPASDATVEEDLPVAEFAWLDEARGEDRVFYCPDTHDLQEIPEESRDLIADSDSRSFVVVAIDGGDDARGYVGFGSSRPGVWLDEDITLLEVAGLIISTALARKTTEEKLVASNAILEALGNSTEQQFWIWQPDPPKLIYSNALTEPVLGLSVAEVTAAADDLNAALDRILPEFRQPFRDAIARGLTEEAEVEFQYRHPDGTPHWLRTRAFPGVPHREDELPTVVGVTEDISERKHAQLRLARLAEFERLVRLVATVLSLSDQARLDREIEAALQHIGQFIGCNRASIYLLKPDRNYARCTHEWTGPDAAPLKDESQNFRFSDDSIVAQALFAGRVFSFDSLEEIPEDSPADREFFRRIGTRARIQIPLMSGADLIGGLMLASTVSNKVWADEEVGLLQIAAEVFANALQRFDVDRERSSRFAIQTQVAHFATEFINVPFSQIGASLDAALANLGSFAGAAEIGLYVIDNDKPIARRRRGWRDPQARPSIEHFPTVPAVPGSALFDATFGRNGYAYIPTDEMTAVLPDVGEGLAAAGIVMTVNVAMKAPDGPIGWLSVGFSSFDEPWPDDTARLFRVAAQAFANVITRQRIEVERRERQAFERLIVELSTDFINVAPEEIDDGIAMALAEIGAFSGIDRLAIFVLDDSEPVLALPYKEWAAPRGSRPIFPTDPLPVGENPHFAERLFGGEGPVDVVVSEWPEEARVTREWLKEREISCFVDFPMIIGGKVSGFFGVASLDEQDPLRGSPYALFALAAEMFANALERRRLQVAADEHRAGLAHALRIGTMAELATGLAHELNQPLTAMSNYAVAGARRVEAGSIDAPELKDLLGRISGEALRAGDIIRRLRAHVRKGSRIRSPHTIEEMFESVSRLLDAAAADQTVQILWEADDDLPQVMVDITEVEQVLINLIQNAVDSIVAHDGARREVRVRASRLNDRMVEVRVEDTGAGIAPEAFETLFDQFSSTKAEGLGLGLAICRLIVESHGGKIKGGTAPGGGAAFTFTLPNVFDPNPN